MNKILILLFLLSLNVFAGNPVSQGEKITANRFNNQTFMVGDIKHSLLTLTQFQQQAGDCWVKMMGQDISGSDYASITGKNLLPDASGRFLRSIGGEAPQIGDSQSNQANSLDFMDFTQSGAVNYNTSIPDDGSYSNGIYTQSSGSTWKLRVRKKGVETRPDNIGVNYFIKINHECN